MERFNIIQTIGEQYLDTNREQSGEFSYVTAGIALSSIRANEQGQRNYIVDIRFEDEANNLSVLVETINVRPTTRDIREHREKLLHGYCELEVRHRPSNNIILILAHSGRSTKIEVYKKAKNRSDIENLEDTCIKPMEEYVEYFSTQFVNDEVAIKTAVLKLNELLHIHDIKPNIRGQFVGTCLLALKDSEFIYTPEKLQNGSEIYNTDTVITSIRGVLSKLLSGDLEKAKKLSLLDTKVLDDAKVKHLKKASFREILLFISTNIIPFINTNTSQGQDLLNLFFTTFNKYVGKADKNQAFTPDHITHFMCKVANVNKHSKVLDPTCGSGSFIVQALIQELYECNTDRERDTVRKNNIFGIENDEDAFGLSTTNMLIHGDGNSNVHLDPDEGCFGMREWIRGTNIDIVLMNPPYNAKPKKIPQCIKDADGRVVYRVHNWNSTQRNSKEDPTKGFCFVNYIADCVGKDNMGRVRPNTKLLCLLPLACAIGSDNMIKEEKRKILENNTLEAVFTLPPEMFYPGSSVNACCMVFTLGQPHFTTTMSEDRHERRTPRNTTFFGFFKDDGFVKKKNIGRISKLDQNNKPLWANIEQYWLDLYNGVKTNESLAVRRKVTSEDEWLAEAYIKTDYSKLTDKDFEKTIRNFLAYQVMHNLEGNDV